MVNELMSEFCTSFPAGLSTDIHAYKKKTKITNNNDSGPTFRRTGGFESVVQCDSSHSPCRITGDTLLLIQGLLQ